LYIFQNIGSSGLTKKGLSGLAKEVDQYRVLQGRDFQELARKGTYQDLRGKGLFKTCEERDFFKTCKERDFSRLAKEGGQTTTSLIFW
jgi:hypothetical protein